MKCEKAQEFFSDYIEGTLEKPLAFTLEHHLKECAACERDYERFQQTWDMLETLPEVEAPSGFRASVMEKIASQQESRKRSLWSLDLGTIFRARIQVRAVAAVAAAGLFATMFAFSMMSPSPTVNSGPGVALPGTEKIGPNTGYIVAPAGESAKSLDMAVSGTAKGGSVVYSINVRPDNGGAGIVTAYLMGQGATSFDARALKSASRVFHQPLSGSLSGSVSVVVPNDAEPQVVCIQWQGSSQLPESTAVYLPSRLSTSRTAVEEFAVNGGTLHEALRKLSSTYGVVVMVDAGGPNDTVGQVSLKGSVDEAFAEVLKDQGLRSKSIGSDVFVVEPK